MLFRSENNLEDDLKMGENLPDEDLTQPATSTCPSPQADMEEGDIAGEVNMLLTAPTGKAANLLGKRADKPAFTLHQVIFSFRLLKEGKTSQ